MLQIESSMCNSVVDGVQLLGTPEKIGPFYHYKAFTVGPEEGQKIEFRVNKIYKVKTLGKIGFASLKMVFHNLKTSKCFARFLLHHFPEDTNQGRMKWYHGEDELITYSQSITIRCCRVPDWTVPIMSALEAGTMPFKTNDMEEHENGHVSVVRLQKKPSADLLGKYSAFAGNAKLTKELGFDVAKAGYVSCSESATIDRSPEHSISCKQVQDQQDLSKHSENLNTIEEDRITLTNKQGSSENNENSLVESSSKDTVHVTETSFSVGQRPKNENEVTGYQKTAAANSRPARSCNSIYGPNRKRKLENLEELPKLPAKRRANAASGASRKRKLDQDEVFATKASYEGVRECKIRILSYNEYLAFRSLKQGLKAGLVAKKDDVITKNVMTTDIDFERVFFTRTMVSEKGIHRTKLFEKPLERKCIFGKKRRNNYQQINISSKPEIEDDNKFKEDNWKEESEDLYFDSVGYKKKKDCKYMKYTVPGRKLIKDDDFRESTTATKEKLNATDCANRSIPAPI